jgi:hypothetical protein
MIKQIVVCDNCSTELRVDECDTPKITMDYAGWKENPENAFEHYCDKCLDEYCLFESNFCEDENES